MKKIMFNDKYGLTKAVLEGRKTQTRRIINPQPMYDENVGICWKGYAYGINFSEKEGAYNNFISGTEYDKSCKRYRVGEIVAVAQSYKDLGYSETALDRSPKDWRIVRGALGKSKGWNNKMFVRVDACIEKGHQIRVTKVRIERLQDISDNDCLAEGIEFDCKSQSFYCGFNNSTNSKIWLGRTPREAYAELIDKVSGKGTWESNPYVFVYDFELIK